MLKALWFISLFVHYLFLNPLTPMPPITNCDEHWPFVPVPVSSPLIKIGIIYTRDLQEEKVFPMIGSWSLRYVRKCMIEWTGIFQLEANPVESQSLLQRDHKKRKTKDEKKINKTRKASRHRSLSKPKSLISACLSKNVVKLGAIRKKGMLSCCNCLFEYIGANLAHIHAENLPKCPKCMS